MADSSITFEGSSSAISPAHTVSNTYSKRYCISLKVQVAYILVECTHLTAAKEFKRITQQYKINDKSVLVLPNFIQVHRSSFPLVTMGSVIQGNDSYTLLKMSCVITIIYSATIVF